MPRPSFSNVLRLPLAGRSRWTPWIAIALACGIPSTNLLAWSNECSERLPQAYASERIACLEAMERSGHFRPDHLKAVVQLLESAEQTTDPLVVATALDLVRAAGPATAETREAVSRLLPYRHALYRGRDKLLVVRLRAYTLVTLAEIGLPESALPALIDTLVHADEQTNVLELAAAARAVRFLAAEGRFFVPHLIQAIPLRRASREISLERFEADFPAAEATTVQREAVRSLGFLASLEDERVVTLLTEIAHSGNTAWDEMVQQEARSALRRITDSPSPEVTR